MSRSLSWIDPAALAASLARAGVETRPRIPVAGVPTPNVGVSSAGVPGNYFQPREPSPQAEPRPATTALGSAAAVTPAAAAQRPQAPPSVTPAAGTSHLARPAGAGPIATPAVEPTTVAAAQATAAATAATAATVREISIEVFDPPASRLHARLEAFMEWVERHVPCHEIFVVDEEGLVLMERDSDPTLIAVSSYFLNFNERIRSSLGAKSQGAIAIDLEGGRTLHVVQAETRLGPHALGFTTSQPLPRKVSEGFRTTLPVVFG